MPQLDGLRAFAVISVAVSHWTPSFLVGMVPWGTAVQLFFVLSGFLITGILLRSRPAESGLTMATALRVFYTRRTLRVFPIYYAVLAVTAIMGVGPIREIWPWHVAYLSNFYYAWVGHGPSVVDPFFHLWSLSVEEQFYLIWPLIALVASPRALLVILYGSIAGSMAFRVGIDHLLPQLVSVRYLTPSCVDAFAVGGLIAHAKHYHGSVAVRRLTLAFAGVGTLGLVLSVMVLSRFVDSEDARGVGHTFLVIFYGAVVAGAAEGFKGIPGRVLSFGPVIYLGQISYGLYVYHHFAPITLRWLSTYYGWTWLGQTPFLLLTYTLFTVLLAVVSWHVFELPINRLKRFFEYPRRRPNPPA